jgi:hypothetical protein
VIEARVLEISPSEVRYKRFDNLNGPTVIVPVASVLSIRYENGTVENFNTLSPPSASAPAAPVLTNKPDGPALDPDKLYVGIFAEPSGFALYGPSLALEFTKGRFNTLINFRIGALGLYKNSDFGAGLVLNYFYPTRLGGFFIGGMLEYSTGKYEYWRKGYHVTQGEWQYGGYWDPNNGHYVDQSQYIDTSYDVPSGWEEDRAHNFGLALGIGYKFILSSGLYFRTGAYAGYTFSTYNENAGFLFRPEVTVGYNF